MNTQNERRAAGGQAPPFQTTLGLLMAGLSRAPDEIFADVDGIQLSYTALEHQSACLASALQRGGIRPGDRVALQLDNSAHFVVAFFAVNRMGAVAVPLNTALVGSFLTAQLQDSGAKSIIAEREYLDRAAHLLNGLPDLHLIIGRDGERAPGQACELETLIRHAEPNRSFDQVLDGRTLAAIMYTSGTTGASKGCMMSHNYLCNMAKHMSEAVRLQPGEVYWTAGPLFHLAALAILLGSMKCGAVAAVAHRFSVSSFWKEIERVQADVVQVIGSMIPLMAQADETEAEKRLRGKIRAVVGAPFTPELREQWMTRFDVPVVGSIGFGMTEASMMLQQNIFEPFPPGAAGRRFPDFEARVVDDNGGDLKPSEIGELVVRPARPSIMFEGYWGRPDATLAAFQDLWFHTGDLGFFDEDGFFYFKDRKKDCLRRRGENISSVEVERELQNHVDVAEVAVIGVPSPLGEDDLKLCVVMSPGSQVSERELQEWSRPRLPRFSWPRFVEFMPALPKNAVGRVLKFELRAAHDSASCWDSERELHQSASESL